MVEDRKRALEERTAMTVTKNKLEADLATLKKMLGEKAKIQATDREDKQAFQAEQNTLNRAARDAIAAQTKDLAERRFEFTQKDQSKRTKLLGQRTKVMEAQQGQQQHSQRYKPWPHLTSLANLCAGRNRLY
jgi:hypothetical protein